MYYVIILIKGIVVGLLASIPLGPIGILCIQRTLSRGRLSGFVSGIGAATVDTLYAAIAGFGITIIIDFVKEQQTILQIISGILVIIIGIRIYVTHPAKEIRLKKQSNTLRKDYLTTLMLTLYNPLTLLAFIGVFTGFGFLNSQNGYTTHLILVSGVFIGAGIWWFILTYLASHFRNSFNLKGIMWLNRIAGIGLFIFGLYYTVISLVEIYFKHS